MTISNRILACLLAVFVVFSTLSFTVEKNYCGDHLVDIAVFTKAKTCGMEISHVENEKKSCCKEEVDVIKGQDDLKVNSNKELSSTQILFLNSLVCSFEALFESLPKQIIPNKDYEPPNLIEDIHVLTETFLI